MCGIAGIVYENAQSHFKALQRMQQSLEHRGPDGNGHLIFNRCGLVHTRLSIVDLDGGQQPMVTMDKKVAVVFNGEISGYKLLRNQLKYPFQTHSDTECLLALYEQYGEAMPVHVKGMFAYAIWDERKQVLHCARDRFGEKPFFYAWGQHGEFIFASEIKAILSTGLVDPQLDDDSVVHYLQKMYVSVNKTIYKNIFTLRPGHVLQFDRAGLKSTPYWTLPPPQINPIGFEDACEEFTRLLDIAMQKQVVADVPVGIFLSGGLDSSALFASAHSQGMNIKGLTHAFRGSESELPNANQVARHYNSELIETHDDNIDLVKNLSLHSALDEPVEGSHIPFLFMCKAARSYCKVMLQGLGGDELLGGYTWWYSRLWKLEHIYPHTSKMMNVAYSLARICQKMGFKSNALDSFTHHYGWRKRSQSIPEIHWQQGLHFSTEKLISMGFSVPDTDFNMWPNTLDSAFRTDLTDYMPSCLAATDKISMLTGLELRSPFLDVDLAEFCISLPSDYKTDVAYSKKLLRFSLVDRLPSTIVWRNNKQGFGASCQSRLRAPGLREYAQDVLMDKTNPIFTYFSPKDIQQILGQWDEQTLIVLMLAIWLSARKSYWAKNA